MAVVAVIQPTPRLISDFLYLILIHADMTRPPPLRLKNFYTCFPKEICLTRRS